jgi:hypothetical protein
VQYSLKRRDDMSDEFMLASREVQEVLKQGDVISTVDGEDYIFHEVSDWAYLYSDKGVRVNPVDVTHVNGKPKRFGYKGLQDKVYQIAFHTRIITPKVQELIRQEMLTMCSRYYNMEHPKVRDELTSGSSYIKVIDGY